VGDGSADGRLDGGGQDGRLDGLGLDRIDVRPSDTGIDVRPSDTGIDVRPSDTGIDVRPSDTGIDVRPSDTGIDVRPSDAGIEVGTSEVRAEVGGLDGRDAPATEGGRADVPTRIDARDAGGDAVPTLSSIEISPASPTVHIGTPLSVVITAVYSSGSTADVSSSATVTSGTTSILTVSGTTLTGVAVGTATITATYQGRTANATVTVLAAPLQSIGIGSVGTITIGQTVNLVATGFFADGSKQDVTAQATWSSSDASIASVGNTSSTKGQLTGMAVGTATVTASILAISGTLQVTVSNSPMASIQITPPQPVLPQGVTQAFKATATYANGTTADVTQQATWSTGDASVLTVVASGANAGLATAQAPGTTSITARVGTVTGTTSVTVIPQVLTSITVNPPTATIMVGSVGSFTATGNYANGTTADLTASVTWSSSNTTVLSVSNATAARGQATGMAVGTANVRATFQGQTGSAAVTVSAAPLLSIAVTPNPLNVPLGITSPLKATGTYGVAGNPAAQFTQDVTTSATWTVADGSITTVGNSATTAGQVTGVKVGSTTVTATLSGLSGSATVNVNTAVLLSVVVAPATATVSAGNTQAFIATGNYNNNTTTDLTTMATWSSSNTAVAEVSNAAGSNGVATTLVRGTATITATYSGMQGTATLTVTAPTLVAIMVAPATATITVGGTQAYTVRGVYQNGTTGALTGVNWSSSSSAVATITAGGGAGGATATGVAAGTTTITATYSAAGAVSLSDTATLTVNAPVTRTPIGIRLTPASASIQVNGTQPYTVNVDYDNGTTAAVGGGVTLTTSNGAVAAVAGGGRGGAGGLTVNGVGVGTATVTATYPTGGQTFTDTATLTVTLIPPPSQVGLYITPATASVKVNGTQQFQAFATYSDGTSTAVTNTTGCAWTTSDGTLATVTSPGGGRGGGGGGGGLATGLAAGTATVNASYGGFSDTATLTVTALPVLKSVVIAPPTATIQVNLPQTFTATAVYSDGTSAPVTGSATWSSSDAEVAVMNVAGGGRGGPGGVVGGSTATGLAVGSATISATYTENGVTATGTAVLTVTDPPLLSLEITPTNPTVSLLSPNQNFAATAIYTDYTTRNVTASTTWSSSNGTVAVISTSGGTIGRATGLAVGTSTIAATYGGMSASTTLTVVTKKVTTIQVTPTSPTAHLGLNLGFVATAIYDDSSTGAVTGSATWTSSDTTVASVGPTGGSAGVATPIKAGSTTITATYQGLSGISLLTVSGAALSSIAITPSPLSVVKGGHQQLTATGTWADSTTADITSNVTWLVSSGDAGGDAIATVSNAAGSRGLLTAVSAGSVTVSAVFQGVTGTLLGTVTASP
jgi:hypothetical protein